MSDIEAETNAFIALVKDADQKLETAYGEIMGGLGQLDALFAGPVADPTLPAGIDDILSDFDAEIAQINQLFHDTLAAEIGTAQKDLAQFDTVAHDLTATWAGQLTETEAALTHLIEKITEIGQRLDADIAQLFIPALNSSLDLIEKASETLDASGNTWAQALHDGLLTQFSQAWQELHDLVAGQYSDTARSLIDAAHDHAGTSISQLIDQTEAAIEQFGHEAQEALVALASHVGEDIQAKLAEAVQHVVETAVEQMLTIALQSIEIAVIGEAITTAMASTGVLEILIPLNALAEAILRAIKILKDPLSMIG